MKVRTYESRESALSQKGFRKTYPVLYDLSSRVPIASCDESCLGILSGNKPVTFKIGIGATHRTPVSLRILAYVAAVLETAKHFNGIVEFVSGGGISSSCGLVSYPEIKDQVLESFELIDLFAKICYPSVPRISSIPVFTDMLAINQLVKIVEAAHPEARNALAYLESLSVAKGADGLQGKQYGILHTFAFDLRAYRQDSIISVGNLSEDVFNCVRYWTLKQLGSGFEGLLKPVHTGHLITGRCRLPPYSYDPRLAPFELRPDVDSIKTLRAISESGRNAFATSTNSVDDLGSVIKDFEFLIRLVGLEKLEVVIRSFARSESGFKPQVSVAGGAFA